MERREFRMSDDAVAGRRQVMSHEDWMQNSASTATSRAEQAGQKRMRAQRQQLVEVTSVVAAKRDIGIRRILKKRSKRAARVAKSEDTIKRPKLEVFVIGCRQLPRIDLFGRADGYVVVQVGDLEQKTKVVTRSYHPVFSQTFIFDVPPLTDSVVMSVYDWDLIGEDDFIGGVSEPLLSAQTKASTLIRLPLINEDRNFRKEACVKFKLRWLPENNEEDAEAAVARGSRKSLEAGDDLAAAVAASLPKALRPWKCQRCKYAENPCEALSCEACEKGRKEAEMPLRGPVEILMNAAGFYRVRKRDSTESISQSWSRSTLDSIHPDESDEEEPEPEESEDQRKARLRKEANLRQYSRSAEERERAAQEAISDLFELADEDEKTRKKRRYREARIAAGKDPDKQDEDALSKALEARKEKAQKGLSALRRKFKRATYGSVVGLATWFQELKEGMWKEDAF